MSSPRDNYEYSTLEVDTDAHTRNQYAETTHAAQFPEVNQNATEHFNYPEVVGVAGDPPKGDIDRTLPEPVFIQETEKALDAPVPPEPRICGMKRKIFWAVVIGAVIAIVAIVAGVVAGVVTRRDNISSSDSSSGQDPAASQDDETALYANTNLATANFTDEFGYENYLVAYQLNNKAIYLSAWNSSHKSWVVSPIVDGKTNNLGLDSVRKGTALSLDVFAYDDTRRDIHVYWQLPDSGGLATIKALTYNNDKGISTQSTIPTANWVDSQAGDSYISTAGSSLASYGKQCDLCNQYTYLYWQTSAGIREASYQNDTSGWYSNTNVIQVDISAPAENASLVQAHAAAATTDGHRSMNLFYRSVTSALSQIVNGDGRYVGHYLGRDIGPKTAIAAFSTGFNETSTGWSEPLGFQVLTMDPTVDDGVQLTYYKGGNWTAADQEVSDLSDCKDRGIIVASHARRIYCLEGQNDNDVKIVEYEWLGDPSDTSTYTNYNKIGNVDVSVK
ncbi:hypothetical protein F5Y00DRAFT_159129 [Daldinia vernicosa]|uniref:uncharacterized protein n=1 Tax=Daldinia vernicosa TaxID=114800 RepID=UPI0020074BB3|nr:uncharacterized protein F5Y00DRAFT_159129 [Daldinia vernicosa]KAI0845892.1 hypothetical protein F5Y00DRAFT_159129 [Daldinia vernicosa]